MQLTDEQIKAIAKEVIPAWAEWTYSVLAFAHAIEAACSAGEQECPHGVDDGACKQCYGDASDKNTKGETKCQKQSNVTLLPPSALYYQKRNEVFNINQLV